MKTWFIPIRILIIYLILLALGASFSSSGFDLLSWIIYARNFTLLVIPGFILYYIFRKFSPTLIIRWEHRLITVLILFLLFDPSLPWWIFVLLRITAECGQRLFRTKIGPIFNPAALAALTLTSIGYAPLWWGVNYAPRIPFIEGSFSIAILLLPIALYVVYRYNKLVISASAFLVFCFVSAIIFQQNPLPQAIDGAFLFFLLVMVTEPKTSPVLRRDQYIYGVLIGALIPIGIYFHFLEAYLVALLIGNLYTKRAALKALIVSAYPNTAKNDI